MSAKREIILLLCNAIRTNNKLNLTPLVKQQNQHLPTQTQQQIRLIPVFPLPAIVDAGVGLPVGVSRTGKLCPSDTQPPHRQPN